MVRAIDYGERLFVVLLAIPFLFSFASVFSAHPQFVLLTISELLAAYLIITRKPGEIMVSPYACAIAFAGTGMPLLVRPVGEALVPTSVTTAFMVLGLGINISAKIFLNRSFGVVAANRGIKRGGPYRVVRHPMYLGYFTAQIGFLMGSFTLYNLLIYAAAWALQILRIREEERLLMQDGAYVRYSLTVPKRLFPGVY
jgi:protein-S-isoprenylcysteine O-methyltransferase Ste14